MKFGCVGQLEKVLFFAEIYSKFVANQKKVC